MEVNLDLFNQIGQEIVHDEEDMTGNIYDPEDLQIYNKVFSNVTYFKFLFFLQKL
jgi:hypothetical protein